MWIAIVGLVVPAAALALGVLGAMRETMILRSEVEALAQLIKNPPAPSYVDRELPESAVRAIRNLELESDSDSFVVAFVSPGCAPCDELVAQLSDAVATGRVERDRLVSVIWASTSEQGLPMGVTRSRSRHRR